MGNNNWVLNKLSFGGNVDDVKLFVDTVPLRSGVVDFTSIIPIPKSLISNVTDEDVSVSISIYNYLLNGDEIDKDIITNMIFELGVIYLDTSELVKRYLEIYPHSISVAKDAIENKDKYGHTTRFSWCLENWGTRSMPSFCSEVKPNENEFYFRTFEKNCFKVIKKLSETTNISIIYEYASEDVYGDYFGKIIFKNGLCINDKSFQKGEACQLWNMDPCYFFDDIRRNDIIDKILENG